MRHVKIQEGSISTTEAPERKTRDGAGWYYISSAYNTARTKEPDSLFPEEAKLIT